MINRFHKKRRRDSLEDKNSEKIRSSSKSHNGSRSDRHEIRVGDVSENKEIHLVEKVSSHRQSKELRLKDHQESNSQKQIVYKDSEKRSERSHKHEKTKRKKDEPEKKSGKM